jgi:hypothetical protein
MSNGEPDEIPAEGFQFFVPPEQEAGTYANTFAIWNTAYDFVIDFGVIQLAQPSDATDPDSPLVTPARVVSRVMIPSSLVFEFVKTINAVMDVHEKQWGPIKHPEFLADESEEEA